MPSVLVLPGDGIGRETVPATVEILTTVARAEGLEIDWIERPCGARLFQEEGFAIAADTRRLALETDAVLLGAVGLPTVRRGDGSEIADEVVLDLRADLDVYANIRPVRSWPTVPGPLNRGDLAYTIVRENTEGLYASRVGGVVLRGDIATDTMVVTRLGTERAVRKAFELARASGGRPLDGRRMVSCVDKANTLRSYVLFRNVFSQVAEDYPDVAADYEHADAMAARMVLRPESLNIVVCENMLGDILSDLAAATVGGLGLAPSANLGDRHGLFEPTHGSAPDLAGRGLANPVATILSGALMLRWLSTRAGAAAERAATRLEAAVERIFADGVKTADVGGSASMLDITARLKEVLS